MISSICVCALLNTSLLFIDASYHDTKEISSVTPLLVTLHCQPTEPEKIDFSFVFNHSLPYEMIVGYTTFVNIPVNIHRCENHTEAIGKNFFQLVVEVRDTNWIFINQVNNSDTATRFCNYYTNPQCIIEVIEDIVVHSFHQYTSNSRLLQKQSTGMKNKWSRPGLWLFIFGVLGAKFW